MEKSIKIDSAMLAKASELYSFIFSIDEEYKNPAQGGERRDLIDGIFAILNGIKPLSYAKYFYDIVHEAFTGYYSTIVLSTDFPVEKYLDATVDDISYGICSVNGLMTFERVWQVYLFTTVYRLFRGACWYYANPIFSQDALNEVRIVDESLEGGDATDRLNAYHLSPVMRVDSERDTCQIECFWWFPAEGLKREVVKYKLYPYRIRRLSVSSEIILPQNPAEEHQV
ncbi:hypothetical protein [Duncaniella muris]|uniref:hypothetical protein n=1 Tax=Duncaniella muris TaxID=2094150 RepID=UPI00272D1906|nr:hypothetical protein [Duncaniella muris]